MDVFSTNFAATIVKNKRQKITVAINTITDKGPRTASASTMGTEDPFEASILILSYTAFSRQYSSRQVKHLKPRPYFAADTCVVLVHRHKTHG
jgi:hypothetical protein